MTSSWVCISCLGSTYCKRLKQTRQNPKTSGTLCQKGLSSNHVSISAHFRIRLAVTSRKTENVSPCAAVQSHQLLGTHPYGRTWTHIKVYSALWTGHIYYHAVTCWCLQVFFQRTLIDWNSLQINTICGLLQESRLPYTVYLASPIVVTEPCHSSSKGCTPMARYPLKNWSIPVTLKVSGEGVLESTGVLQGRPGGLFLVVLQKIVTITTKSL